MKNDYIEMLMARKLAGEATKQEEDELQFWLNSSPKNKEEYHEVALTYQLSKGKLDAGRKSIVFERLNSRIEAERTNELKKDSSFQRAKVRWTIAASIVLFISIGLVFYSSTNVENPIGENISLIEKTNPAGQKSKIFLPDGSIVWLNSESTISYNSEFNDSIRYVEMNGEAYFEVKKDASRPFVVVSKNLTTVALGTAFNINTFSRDNHQVLIALTEGKISVENTEAGSVSSPLIIYPGEGVRFNPQINEEMQKINIDIEGVKQWKDGILELNNATLLEATELLSRWYGVEFELRNNPSRNWNATGVFDNEYLENVLSTISFSQGFDYEFNGKKVYITFKKK